MRIFRFGTNDPSRGWFKKQSGDPPDRRRQLGDKLQLLALQHPASLKILEEMVDDMVRRLQE